jgi:hypothetical protein
VYREALGVIGLAGLKLITGIRFGEMSSLISGIGG